MKRWLLIAFAALACGSLAAAETVFLGGDGATTADVRVLSDTPNETVISFTLAGFTRTREEAGGVSYDRVALGNCGGTYDVGLPELPVLNETVMVPGDREVRAEVVAWDEVTLEGYNLWPFQTPPTDYDDALPFVRDDAYYARGGVYPQAQTVVGEPAIFRDLRVVPLAVFPFRWNAATKELKVARRAVVKLSYYGQSDANALRDTGYRDPDFVPLYKATVLNYRPGMAPVRDAGGNLEHAEYLVIYSPAFSAQIDPLVEFYNKMGVYCKAVSSTVTGTDKDSVKNYIQQVYDETSPPALKYVLLVGDISLIEAGRRPGYGFVSDYWYQLLTGGQEDPYPDINVGRITTTEGATVTLAAEKSINYQKSPTVSDNWLDNVALIAHMQYSNGYESCCEEVRNYNYALFNPNWTTIYGGQGKYNSDVAAAINSGMNIAAYRGHGSTTAWTQWNIYYESWGNTDVYGLTNSSKIDIVFDCCCDNMDLDAGGLTIGEVQLNHSSAHVAAYGASDPSWTFANHDLYKEFFKAIYDSGVYNVARVSNYACARMIDIYGPNHMYIDNCWMYLWNGDPFTRIWLRKPTQTLAASHPSSYTPGDNRPFTVTVTVSGSPVSGALVGLYKKDDIYCAGVTDGSGSVTLYPKAGVGSAGTMYVTATKETYLGYWGSCAVAETTDIKISNFDARYVDDGVRLAWSVDHAAEVLGFNLYRRELADARKDAQLGGPFAADDPSWARVNDSLIVGKSPYSYVDHVGDGEFRYRLEAITDGARVVAGPIGVNGRAVPKNFALGQNFPNPARTSTHITFSLPADTANVSLRVYDLSGREIKTYELGGCKAGVVNLSWALDDNRGMQVPAGVYVYRLDTPAFTAVKKLIVVR